jgi:hypothetical protein
MTGQVTVGAEAVVRGNINATEISISGSVAGNLSASDTLLLNAGARVVGDLGAVRIGIAEGALVRGIVRTEGEPPLVKPVVTAARAVAKPVVLPRSPAAQTAQPVRTAVAPARPIVAPKPAPTHEASSAVAPPAQSAVRVDGPPPLVVPALKSPIKAKKKFKGK